MAKYADLYERVARAYDHWGWAPDEIRELDRDAFEFRLHCMLEEISEYVTATTHAERLDALVDLTVFALGTAVMHGYRRFPEAFHAVMAANELKVAGPVEGQRGESRFDLGKPPGWKSPDLREFVGEMPLDLAREKEKELRRLAALCYCGSPPCTNTGVSAPECEYCPSVAHIPPTEEERALAAEIHEAFHDSSGWTEERCQNEARRGMRINEVNGLKIPYYKSREEMTEEQKVHRRALLGDVPLESITLGGYTIDQIYAIANERDLLKLMLADAERKITELEDELEAIPGPMREASRLLVRKAHDYNRDNPDLSKRNYHPFGHLSYLQMLHTKLERLKSVAGQEETNFESARDSALDLINYATFYAAWLEEEEAAKITGHEVKRAISVKPIRPDDRVTIECQPATVSLGDLMKKARTLVSPEEEEED